MTTVRFLDYITYEKRFSPNTILAYKIDLDQFYDYLQRQYEVSGPKDITHPMIRSWIATLLENDISPRSINRKITTLKTYYRFLLKEKIVEENPMQKILSQKSPTRLPAFVQTDSMEKLFDQVEFKDNFEGHRDRIILELLYATGMRLSELINLNTDDVDLPRLQLKVTGKRNKQRIIPFSNIISSKIENYLEKRKEVLASGFVDSHLFITDKGTKLYPKLVYRVVNHYLNEVTTLSKKSPHVIRHTFATHMLNNGADLNAIKEILGHANLAATQVYTHNTIEKLKSIYKQAHPKA